MLRGLICAAAIFTATAAYANAQEQQWEIGAIGGFGYSPNLTVSNSTTSASTGVKTGLAVGVYGGEDMYRYWSGEASYLYRAGDLKLDGSGKSASFGAHTHLITGDFLAHFRPRSYRSRLIAFFRSARCIALHPACVNILHPAAVPFLSSRSRLSLTRLLLGARRGRVR